MARDPYREAATGWNRPMAGCELVINRSQRCTGADRHRLAVRRGVDPLNPANIDDKIGTLRKSLIRATAGTDGKTNSIIESPEDRRADRRSTSSNDTHPRRQLSSLAEGDVILTGGFGNRNQNHIFFGVQRRLQRGDRQAGVGFGPTNGKQRTPDHDLRRQPARDLQKFSSLHVLSLRSRRPSPNYSH